jgi:hypothetical protein
MRGMAVEPRHWKPTRSQLSEATWLVLGGAFVSLIGLRQPVIYVTLAGLAIWMLVVSGCIGFNIVRKFRQR